MREKRKRQKQRDKSIYKKLFFRYWRKKNCNLLNKFCSYLIYIYKVHFVAYTNNNLDKYLIFVFDNICKQVRFISL